MSIEELLARGIENLRKQEMYCGTIIKPYEIKIKQLNQLIKTLEKENLPSTNLSEQLKRYNGRKVTVYEINPSKYLNDEQVVQGVFNYQSEENGDIISLDGKTSTKLIGRPISVKKIIDNETGVLIFENNNYLSDITAQYALLFGKKRGIEIANHEIKKYQEYIDDVNYSLEEYRFTINSIPTWVERGEKVVKPEKFDKWKAYVVKWASGAYGGKQIELTLRAMEILNEGKSVEEARKLVENNYIVESEYSKEQTKTLISMAVKEFSPRGKEFAEKAEKTK